MFTEPLEIEISLPVRVVVWRVALLRDISSTFSSATLNRIVPSVASAITFPSIVMFAGVFSSTTNEVVNSLVPAVRSALLIWPTSRPFTRTRRAFAPSKLFANAAATAPLSTETLSFLTITGTEEVNFASKNLTSSVPGATVSFAVLLDTNELVTLANGIVWTVVVGSTRVIWFVEVSFAETSEESSILRDTPLFTPSRRTSARRSNVAVEPTFTGVLSPETKILSAVTVALPTALPFWRTVTLLNDFVRSFVGRVTLPPVVLSRVTAKPSRVISRSVGWIRTEIRRWSLEPGFTSDALLESEARTTPVL